MALQPIYCNIVKRLSNLWEATITTGLFWGFCKNINRSVQPPEHGPSSRIFQLTSYYSKKLPLCGQPQPRPARTWPSKPQPQPQPRPAKTWPTNPAIRSPAHTWPTNPETSLAYNWALKPKSTIHKTSLLHRLISCFILVTCIFLLLSFSRCSMAEDDVPQLEATRLELNRVIDEVQEIRTDLMTQEDEPAYELLDCGELEDLDADLGALLNRGCAFKAKLLTEELDEGVKAEDSKHWKALQKMVKSNKGICRRLIATREVYGKIQMADRILTQLKARRLEFPHKDYSTPTKRISDKVTDLMESLENSTLPVDHKLRTQAMELEISLEDMEIVDVILSPEDSKTSIKPKVEPPKMQAIAPPTFSGQQRDWQAFWAAFRDIHDCPKYSNTAKLCYLRQAQKDNSLHQQLCENVSHGDSYDDVVAGLKDQFDRPREDHRIYLENITRMQPVKATRASLMACATSLQSSINGMTRLGQVDIHSIFTTLVEPLLPEKVKAQWEEATVESKTVPAVDKLITFLRKRAAMPQYADKPQTHIPAERKSFKQQGKHKASVHVATTAPAPPSTQPTESRPTSPTHANKVTSTAQPHVPKPRTHSFPPCRYTCPLCKEAHYAWGCSAFKEKSLAQRKEHVLRHSLCNNCLKPGHSQADCKSRFTCQTCDGKHNTLLHTPASSGNVNHIAAKSSTNNLNRAKLLMTCEVLVTGPTGKSMPVRALLDSGADVSSITAKVANHLKLKQLKDTVAVATFGSSTERICSTTTFTLSSRLKKDWSHQVSAILVDKITGEHPRQDASIVKSLPAVKDLTPADPQFHRPGRIDVLLGADVLPYVQSTPEPPSSIIAVETVFGHAFMGTYTPTSSTSPIKASIQLATESSTPDTLRHLIQQVAWFWETENPLLMTSPHNTEELRVLAEYAATYKFLPQVGKYQVILPRTLEKRQLGESKTQALQRYYQNISSLKRKGKLQEFLAVLQEYIDLNHARPCTAEELQLPSSSCYHLPMHGVVKASSTTTKLRIVFDGSAVTTSGWSLNNTLAVGPMLHPKLAEILLRFRKYRVALSGDISKMYREILLSPADQQYHRFFWQPSLDEPARAYCMNRVTFGVTCSPFLAVRCLQQAASDFGGAYPNAQQHIRRSFYVDDLLGGADTAQEAIKLYSELSEILKKGGFTLRKYRSNSQQVLKKIPKELREKMPTKEMIDCHSESYPKALGVVWDSVEDTMCTDVTYLGKPVKTKKEILSDTSRTFDILGWITPAVLPMKVLFQELWQLKIGWDDELPQSHLQTHQAWRQELPMLSDIQIPRSYYLQEEALTIQLHGFSDASEKAFGAVIYVRATYANHSPTCRLVTAKSRVAPLKQRTIPELELCGAVLLANLLETTASIIDIPTDQVTAWCDSTIVLCWLRNCPSRYKTFVANRITTATNHFPPSIWRHVPTYDNPADCASRGLSAKELREHQLWWNGPPWLVTDPMEVPRQPQAAALDEHRDNNAKTSACLHITAAPAVWITNRFSSYNTLTKVTAWVIRAVYNFLAPIKLHPLNKDEFLTVEEVKEASTFLLKRSQRRAYNADISLLTASPPRELEKTSHILALHPFMGSDGLLLVGGRLSKAPISYFQRHPILLSAKDPLSILILETKHITLFHCGPTLLCSTIGLEFYITGVKQLARTICKRCVVCKKVAAKAQQQLMGQLPVSRLTEAPAFTTCGVDYAGPFLIKTNNLRNSPSVKGYLSVFVCFASKAVHLEVVTGRTTEAFLAALKRFTSRRGLPKDIYSDNDGTFRGANKDLQDLYQLLKTPTWTATLKAFFLNSHINWHNIPERAPHFGGLWEAAVKSAKHHLKRVVGEQRLTYEELSTIAAQVEACLNSRPLLHQDSHSPDGIQPPTPGHALIGKPIVAYPETAIPPMKTYPDRWTLCQGLVHQFWKRWSTEYFHQLQAAHKWKTKRPNLCVGDIVLMRDASEFTTHWGLAKVAKVFPGEDGLVRAVEVTVKKAIIPENIPKKSLKLDQIKIRTSTLKRPVAKLALLVPNSTEGSLHRGEYVQAIT